MTQPETLVRNAIQIAWNPVGRLFRNQRYKGHIVRQGRILPGFVDAGIGGDGGSDLVGFTSVTITPDMVGRVVGVATFLEVKTDTGKASDAQKHFVEVARKFGCIAGIVRSAEEAEMEVSIWKAGF